MGANQGAAANSMEKLASGLRINRAGDDAAGLAISEKMRAQIRGLDQASRNSQDGISMIQTAEGALQETHNILQRMRELATQAANDTNVEVDRAEIQKEMNQLTSEINRIGNTTEFNTQSLLKGNINKADIGATASSVKQGTDATNTQAVWSTGNITALGDTDSGTFKFNDFTLTISGADGADNAIAAGGTATAATLNLDTDASEADQASAIAAALQSLADGGNEKLKDFKFEAVGDAIVITGPDVENSGKYNDLRIYADGDLTITNDNSTEALQSLTTAGVDGKLATSATSTLTFDKVPTEGSTFSVAGKQVGFFDSSKSTFEDANSAKTALEADFVIDVNGKSTAQIAAAVAALDFKGYDGSGNADQSGATAVAVGNQVTFTAETAGAAASDIVKVETNDAHAGSKTSYTANAVVDVSAPLNGDLTGADFQMEIIVGDKAFTVDSSLLATDLAGLENFGSAQQETVLNALKNATASDGTKLSDVVNVSFDNGNVNAGEQTLVMEAKNVGTDNIRTILTGADASDAATVLGISEGTDKGTAGTQAFESGEKNFTATFQVGANQGQSMTINIGDMRANALNISGTSAAAAHSDVEGAKFTATSNVTDGTNNANVEFALDVSSSESASAAIKVINNAIEKISSQRSELGAFQNRLEHTISNLSNAAENLQAAESRIRDVDMAREVMDMTKNNILAQASQAMLAQANQAPQAVLQLLG